MANTVSKKFDENATPNNAEEKKSPMKKPDADRARKVSAQDGAQASGSGWFGGIFSKLSIKPKNQMILPDDKNPTVSLGLIITIFYYSLSLPRSSGMNRQSRG